MVWTPKRVHQESIRQISPERKPRYQHNASSVQRRHQQRKTMQKRVSWHGEKEKKCTQDVSLDSSIRPPLTSPDNPDPPTQNQHGPNQPPTPLADQPQHRVCTFFNERQPLRSTIRVIQRERARRSENQPRRERKTKTDRCAGTSKRQSWSLQVRAKEKNKTKQVQYQDGGEARSSLSTRRISSSSFCAL
jgi:hypothetical protein